MFTIKNRGRIFSGETMTDIEWIAVNDKEDLLVEVFTSEELFEDLSIYWRDLEKRANCKVCSSYDWSFTWWQHYGKNAQRSLFIITFWDGTQLVGVAPFYRGYSTVGNFRLETRLQLIGSGGSPSEQFGFTDDYGISDFLDIIVDRAYQDVVADRLVDLLTPDFTDADVVKFHQAGDDSFIMKYLYPRLQKDFPNVKAEQTDVCPYINLRDYGSIKEYIKDQKSNARRRLRQTLRAEGEAGEEEYLIEDATVSWEKIEEAIDNTIELHQDRWNRLGFPGVFYDERFTAFFRDTIKYAFDNGWLWFKQARDEVGVCATRMILYYNDHYYDYISGFDELRPSSKYRPGIGLLVDLVDEAIANNADGVELLRGEEGYKYDFTSESFHNWRITIPLRGRKFNLPLLFNYIAAFVYKYGTRETRLLNVQRKQKGWAQMLFGYISFRWTTVKLKWKALSSSS